MSCAIIWSWPERLRKLWLMTQQRHSISTRSPRRRDLVRTLCQRCMIVMWRLCSPLLCVLSTDVLEHQPPGSLNMTAPGSHRCTLSLSRVILKHRTSQPVPSTPNGKKTNKSHQYEPISGYVQWDHRWSREVKYFGRLKRSSDLSGMLGSLKVWSTFCAGPPRRCYKH